MLARTAWYSRYNALLAMFSACATLVEGAFPHNRLAIKCTKTMVTSSVKPLAGGANTALVLHLAQGSVDPAFVADVGAKEKNQDSLLGLVLLATR